MSQNGAALFPDFQEELNAKLQERLVGIVGRQTIELATANAAAEIFSGRCQVLEAKWGEGLARLEELEADLAALREQLATQAACAEVPDRLPQDAEPVIDLHGRGYRAIDKSNV